MSGAPQPEYDADVFPAPSAPYAVARRLYGAYTVDKNQTLKAWRGGWMRWHITHWEEIDAAELRSEVYKTLAAACYWHATKNGNEIRDWNPTKRKVGDVLEAMAAIGHLSSTVDPPWWIKSGSASSQVISCTNGLLDLSMRTMQPHSPSLFNLVSVPFAYVPTASEPVAWLKFLKSVWADDADSIALLQEFFGYVLSGRLDMQKMLLLIGPTRSGKGTIARVLTELIGRLHVAGPTLASLGTNFGLSPLLGRPLAIISDARLGDTPAHAVVERLLSITGEDMMTIDRKYRDPWSGKLPTRFVILSNELPRFKDASAAIAGRMLILQMTQSFLGREDRTLDERLHAELPGILLWALEGLDRLQRYGRFTVPRSSADAAVLMMDLASPVSAFIRDRCVRAGSASVERDVLYATWKMWCDENGHRPTAKATFGRDLRAVVPGLGDERIARCGHRVRCYVGIGLRPGTDDGQEPGQPGRNGESAYQSGDPRPGESPGQGRTKSRVKEPCPGGPGTDPLWRSYEKSPGGPKVCCDCGEVLFAPESVARRRCERCHLDRGRS